MMPTKMLSPMVMKCLHMPIRAAVRKAKAARKQIVEKTCSRVRRLV